MDPRPIDCPVLYNHEVHRSSLIWARNDPMSSIVNIVKPVSIVIVF